MSNANYLAHFGTKGQKHGLRRHQSYETAPTRSGMVGQEVGEAARQSERLNRRNEQDDRNGPRRGPMQYEAKPTYKSPSDLAKASKKQTLKEKLRAKKAEKDAQNVEKNKAKWATNYKDLEAHKDAFTNKELEYALNRLNLTNRIKSDRWEQTRNLTQKGADTMKNLANASRSFVDIYNVVAGGYNTYQNYKSNKANKIDLMPKWNASSGQYNINNQNNNNQQHKKDNNQKKPKTINTRRGRFRGHADHSGMSATEYIAHFGIPGQKKGIRNFQSCDTAPTRSGMVGEERGLAAKQAARLGEEEPKEYSGKDALKSLGLDGYDRLDSEYSFGKFTSYDKNIDSDTDGFVRFSLDKEDVYKQESVDTMKRAEKEWSKIKANVIPDVKADVIDMIEHYDSMSRSEAEKMADKMFKPSNLYFHVRPTMPGFVEISLYSNESPYGDHSFDFEYDVYNHKKEPGFAMNG